jgi:predicted transcriptional regulator
MVPASERLALELLVEKESFERKTWRSAEQAAEVRLLTPVIGDSLPAKRFDARTKA